MASLIFIVAIGFSILPATIVGAVMYERESKLKHIQVISGMNMCSYWFINVLFDIFKMEIPMVLSVGLLFAFQLEEYYQSAFVFLLFPIGVVPFTHAMSFLFASEWSAQFSTIVLNLGAMMFTPLIVFVMQQFSDTAEIADMINYYARVIPSYNVAKSILFFGTAN